MLMGTRSAQRTAAQGDGLLRQLCCMCRSATRSPGLGPISTPRAGPQRRQTCKKHAKGSLLLLPIEAAHRSHPAAPRHVVQSQGQPSACSHCKPRRWPPSAAARQVSSLMPQSFRTAHSRIDLRLRSARFGKRVTLLCNYYAIAMSWQPQYTRRSYVRSIT